MVGSVNRGYQAERDRLGDQAKASRVVFDQGFQEWVPGQLSRHCAWGYISTDPASIRLHADGPLAHHSSSTGHDRLGTRFSEPIYSRQRKFSFGRHPLHYL